MTAGEYEVKVIDEQDCPNIQYVKLIEPEKINIDIVNSEDESCTYNNDGVIEIEVTGGPDSPVSSQNYLPFEYQWTKHNQFYSSQKNIYGLESGTYTLSVTDKNGCTSIKSKEINQPPFVIADYRVLDDTVTIQYPIINIFDNSEGNIIEWYWELSNGFTSTNQNIYNLDLSTELDSSGVKYYDLKLVVMMKIYVQIAYMELLHLKMYTVYLCQMVLHQTVMESMMYSKFSIMELKTKHLV